ncbi:unnamed protein product, partial [Leptidea sinapis]
LYLKQKYKMEHPLVISQHFHLQLLYCVQTTRKTSCKHVSDFDITESDNDVGIMRLSTAIVYGKNVQPVNIVSTNYNVEAGEPVSIIGWGITQNMICAAPSKEDGVDFCDGDVGAPLLHNNTLVGIASFRDPTCGRQEYPGIYTRIAKYTVPSSRISNGASVDISSFPFAAVLLRESLFGNFVQSCVGSIVNNRCILTSANCFYYDVPSQWSVRLGSSYASSGGTIYSVAQLIGHPQFDVIGSDNDVGLMRLSSAIVYGTNVQRRGNLITINQQTCRSNYNLIGMTVTNNMQCAGAGSILGADFCDGDIGAPLLHNNVLAGIASWRTPICGLAYYPGIFTRVNIYSNWIVANA